ncbi:MAG TPA: response regulator [Candidatus Paceibacterota bacterium]|nr:response regulator [Candidatus Paceibacterota bacterium]
MKEKILLIEDDAFLGDVLRRRLEVEGYSVSLARDGLEGWNMISVFRPDLILLDIVLPSMNGYEILEARAKDEFARSVPVIVISNSGQPVEINRILSLGVVDYLVKSHLEPEEVLSRVRAVFNGKDAGTAQTATRLAGRKILWVEDDAFLKDLMEAKFKREGCISLHAPDGAKALEILKTEVPDIIMIDLVLPDISGFELMSMIKKDERVKSVPLIVLSNLGQQSEIERTKQLGAIKHLVKAEREPDEIMQEIADTLAASKPAVPAAPPAN